ncbi:MULTISPECIES: DUF445 domain-containing protein [unclassified Acinetobacter]|uniref:DUF445 domain-containing protein n=1 Tax=unclassified Acinetobacter TaxID=196816 RepID=UPI0035B83DF2
MNSSQTQQQSSLKRAKRYATIALVVAIVSWVVLMIFAKFFPQYAWLIHILMLSAEAGVVGGFADWYAITVLFRNPFGKLPVPKLLLEHTEIIPRNKARIAESMGRFVQENFLSPVVVQRSLHKSDPSLALGQWLKQPQNSQKVVEFVQYSVPKIFEFVGEQQIMRFIQSNSKEWLQNTPINHLSSELLRAILDNRFHHDVLQRGLDAIQNWIQHNPERAHAMAERLFEELGVGKLARGVGFFGIDVQQRSVDALLQKITQIIEQPEHRYRQRLENFARELQHDLQDSDSTASIKLNTLKDSFLNSPQLLSFLGNAVNMLCKSITKDLQQTDSGIANNLQYAIMQLGENIQDNQQVREVFNERLITIATQLSEQYGDKVILFISERIHEWDSSEMIAKIENSVGGDLHMIRVNGVVVGAFIGLILGIIRAIVEHVL